MHFWNSNFRFSHVTGSGDRGMPACKQSFAPVANNTGSSKDSDVSFSCFSHHQRDKEEFVKKKDQGVPLVKDFLFVVTYCFSFVTPSSTKNLPIR